MRQLINSFDFLLIFSLFFVGDFKIAEMSVLPFLVLLSCIYFVLKGPSIKKTDGVVLLVLGVYLSIYFIVNIGAVGHTIMQVPKLLIGLFLVCSILSHRKVPEPIGKLALLLNLFFLAFLLLGKDPSPFGPNVEYRIYAFLFILSIINRKWRFFGIYNVAYFFYSLLGYSRGGFLTFLFLNSLRFRFFLLSLAGLVLVLFTLVYSSGAGFSLSGYGFRSLYFNLENSSELGRLNFYFNAIEEIRTFGIKEHLFGNPSYFITNFYSHNAFLDFAITFGLVPSIVLTSGIIIFILNTVKIIFTPNSNYFLSYFYAVLMGSMLSGGMFENWALLVAGLLGLGGKRRLSKI